MYAYVTSTQDIWFNEAFSMLNLVTMYCAHGNSNHVTTVQILCEKVTSFSLIRTCPYIQVIRISSAIRPCPFMLGIMVYIRGI